MEIQVTPTGIPGIGALSWGTHVCQFYDGREDLADYLVPTSRPVSSTRSIASGSPRPLSVEDAQMLLRAAVPDLDTRAGRGQIEFVDYRTGISTAAAWTLIARSRVGGSASKARSSAATRGPGSLAMPSGWKARGGASLTTRRG